MVSSSACRRIETCVHLVRNIATWSWRLPGVCISVRPWELCRQFPGGGYVFVLRGSSFDGISAWRLASEFRIASSGCTLLARRPLCSCMFQSLYSVAPCVTSNLFDADNKNVNVWARGEGSCRLPLVRRDGASVLRHDQERSSLLDCEHLPPD